ncbi:MAG: hypothetical protein DIU72_002680 [Pseudomonadota bacterium]
MRLGVDPHHHALADRVVGVLVHRQDAEAEDQAGPSELLDPDADPHLGNAPHGTQVVDVVGAYEMRLVGRLPRVEQRLPAEDVIPERADGPLDQKDVAGVVKDLEGVQIVEVDTVDPLEEAHGARHIALRACASPALLEPLARGLPRR